MTNFEWLRERLEQQAGLHLNHGPAPLAGVTYVNLVAEETVDDFVFKMDNRLLMGRLRYGPRKRLPPYHGYILNKLEDKLILYQRTGNLEYLVDAANYCRLEYQMSLHPNKHFKAMDRET